MIDKASKERIAKLHPSIRAEVTEIVMHINTKILTRVSKVMITQGLRTFAEQDALYAQGRTKPGKKVTNAKGGQSVHNYGFAIDFALGIDRNGDGKFEEVIWDTKKDFDADKQADWMEVVVEFKRRGWVWGGDWVSFKDLPHLDKKGYGDWRALSKLKKDCNGYVII